ncbi:MAG TPA: sulfurtransferase-like selenium metabolism protein YedF [Spirochaetota bacterium]|nr:sulfurtransferase-like selenium metabolism protein YedF [Spirochaetota bacterium]HPS85606.1 sulfurtransferase-like selenium metabolism protein YedF [Spirochaetota bacterium]
MKYKIDAKGLACPQPVVLTKNKMKECSQIEVIVDNETALENIKRLAESSGWTCEYKSSGTDYVITLQGDKAVPSEAASKTPAPGVNDKSIIVFSSNKMGKGDDELGAILMKAFIHTITTLDNAPSALLFYNSGVLLAADESGVTDDLQVLSEKGVELLVCGTCVNYFKITDKIKIGTVSNMFDILNTMNKASRIINP